MTGFIQDPLQLISQLENDLRDRYPTGFPVLKELIQNADDAGATHVEFGIRSGVDSADHPLLQGPGFFLINNGQFCKRDDIGIRSFGLSSKTNDQKAIGKFGLGMKSVFHFCEAFFYLAHDGQEGYQVVLNPWSVPKEQEEEFPPKHPEWDDFLADDAEKLRKHLEPLIREIPLLNQCQPFLLWLPLRRQQHLQRSEGGETGCIVSEFPGDDDQALDFLRGPALPSQLAIMAPLLRSVNSIRFWDEQGAGTDYKPKFSVTVAPDAVRLQFPGDQRDERLCGWVEEKMDLKLASRLPFIGQEKMECSSELTKLYDHPKWPRNNTRDTSSGRSEQVRDKTQPHAAVVLSHKEVPDGSGQLKIRWAVFLPLDEDLAGETIECGGDIEFNFTLHGYFFVDAGRRAIHGFDSVESLQGGHDTEDAVRTHWNYTLAQQGPLRMLLPVLNDYASSANLREPRSTFRQLTEAFKNKSQIWKRFRTAITAEHEWALVITLQGSQWALLKAGTDLLPLPEPPLSHPTLPWTVFPSLSELENSAALIAYGEPALTRTDRFQWPEDRLLRLLACANPSEILGDRARLDYFTRTVTECFAPYGDTYEVQNRLIHLFRQGFAEISPENLRGHRAAIQQLSKLIQPERRLPVKKSVPPTDLLSRILKCDTESLLLLAEFDAKDAPGQSRLSTEDALKLVRELHTVIAESANQGGPDLEQAALELAQEILSWVPAGDRRSMFQWSRDLKILRAYDGSCSHMTAVSPATIQEALQQGLLFTFSQGTVLPERLGLASRLQDVLVGDRVLLVTREVAELVLEKDSATTVKPCDERACLITLGTRVRKLGDPASRKQLLDHANDPDADVAAVQGLRFLLHSNIDHFYDRDKPLWVRGYQQSEAWEKLWGQLSGRDGNWSLIASELADCVPRGRWDLLQIREVRPEKVLEELERVGVQSIDPEIFSSDECAEILAAALNEAQWRSLPLHETLDGERTSVVDHERAFLDVERNPPEGLATSVLIIRRSHHRKVAAQQEDWLRPLDHGAFISLALAHSTPAHYVTLILDSLASVKDIDEGQRKALRETKWLIDRQHAVFAPQDVIDLNDPAGDLEKLVWEAPGTYTVPSCLDSSVQEHAFFPQLREGFFAHEQEGLDVLALLLSSLPPYRVGELTVRGAGDLKSLIEVLGNLPTTCDLPGWGVLARLVDAYGLEDVFHCIFQAMLGPIPEDTVVQILEWIPTLGQASPAQRSAFENYLHLFARSNNAKNRLHGLRLIDRGGHWRPAEELCAKAENIAARYVLSDSQIVILANVIVFADSRDTSTLDQSSNVTVSSVDAAAAILAHYFQNWQGRVPDPLIGCFACLCGGEPAIRRLASQFLGVNHTPEWLVAFIPWTVPTRRDDGALAWLHGMSLEQAINYFRFTVHTVDKEVVDVRSILGGPVQVRLDTDFRHLLVGAPRYHRITQGETEQYRVDIALRVIDTDAMSNERLGDYLKASIEYLIREVYAQRQATLDHLWVELDRSDQLHIDLARELMMEHMPFYVRQLGVQRHPRLEKALRSYDKARLQEVEFRRGANAKDYLDKRREALLQVQQVIEKESEVQISLLQAVREKVKDYQYRKDSIPFELFQNADDAVLELERIEAYPSRPGDQDVPPLPATLRRLVIIIEEERVVLMHWGRPINWVGRGDFQGSEHGYHRDLEKMLILSASDKGGSASDKGGTVTGKFGLGFKSVFLACDNPRIVSGRLSVDVIGGMLPTRLQDDQELRGLLEEYGPGERRPGTAVEIPLSGATVDEIFPRFRQMIGFLCVFGKAIRQIEIVDRRREKQKASWEAEPVNGLPQFSVGKLYLGSDQGTKTGPRAVRLDLGEGELLLALGEDGFCPFPAGVPTIWATAPTQEDQALGFALNGRFEVDAGRTRLSSNEEGNREVAKNLGIRFREVLEGLHDSLEDGQSMSQSIAQRPDLTPYELWQSLWKTLCDRTARAESSGVKEIVRTLLRESLGKVAEGRRIVPNGLLDEHRNLVAVEAVRNELRGALAREPVIRALMKWEPFRKRILPDNSISGAVADWLRFVTPDVSRHVVRWRSVALSDLATWFEGGTARVTPADADLWEQAFDSLNQISSLPKEITEDREDALRTLQGAYFCSEAGSWRPAAELLHVSGQNDDEGLRWGFAPADRRLSLSYREPGKAFFRRCRRAFDAPAAILKQWVLQATDDERRRAALRYLMEGELANRILQALQESESSGTWLGALDHTSSYFTGCPPTEVNQLLWRFLPQESLSTEEWTRLRTGVGVELPLPRPVDTVDVLTRIQDWWKREGCERLRHYEQSVYPGGFPPRLNYEDDAGKYDRSAWLTLLFVGALYKLGRTKPEQHRQFVELCQQRNWWDNVFVAPKPETRADEWMGVLDEFIDSQKDSQEYEEWMLRFPVIYRLARYLDDYRELFLRLGSWPPNHFSLKQALKPRTTPALQGGGVDAPPLEKTLGIGACFVMRELLRLGLVKGEHLSPYAFVPSGGVRRLLEKIGWSMGDDLNGADIDNSPRIHWFLTEYLGEEGACFGGDYDIPLRLIASNQDLQHQFLGFSIPEEADE